MNQHLLDTYESEAAKTDTVWARFTDGDLDWRPDPRSRSVREIFEHQLLSERRFFGEFLDAAEPAPLNVLPSEKTVSAYRARFSELCAARMPFVSSRAQPWWLETVRFFDVERQRMGEHGWRGLRDAKRADADQRR